MTYQSELISPITHEAGERAGRDEPQGQVLAADDDDDDMRWLEIPLPDICESSDVENEEQKEGLEAAGVPVGGEAVSQQYRPEQVRARVITRPESLTKTQCKQHILVEGHANYHPG